jgi:large subunit ribosomal protein L29
MNGEQVRSMTDDEMSQELQRIRRHLFDLRTQAVTEKVDDPTLFRQAKRDIARILGERRARALANTPDRQPRTTRRQRQAAAKESQA